MPAGYSGTPLPKKLGIKEDHTVGLHGAPSTIPATLGKLPPGADLAPATGHAYDIILLFVRDTKSLEKTLPRMLPKMTPTSALWVCWPKKTSPLASDVSGDVVRATGLAAGIVDIKVCAIDEDWSGLKFVYRLKDRPNARKK